MVNSIGGSSSAAADNFVRQTDSISQVISNGQEKMFDNSLNLIKADKQTQATADSFKNSQDVLAQLLS